MRERRLHEADMDLQKELADLAEVDQRLAEVQAQRDEVVRAIHAKGAIQVQKNLAAGVLPTCPLCLDHLWVCEYHPYKHFQHDDCGGPGIRCGCNPKGEMRWKTVFATTDPERDKPTSSH
jgi:hypothetical protein